VAPPGWTLWAGQDIEWENDVDAGGFPYLTVVVGTSLASLMLVMFGLLRRRSPMAWESGQPTAGMPPETPIATDPTIARRIAELVPPPSDDDAYPGDGHEANADPVGGYPAGAAPELGELLLSDGSDESVDDPDAAPITWPKAAVEALAWPVADPGVIHPLLDPPAATDPAPTVDRQALSRLLTDPVTGLGTAVAWELWIADEDPRERRYRRPTTIVLAELDGLDAVVAVHGAGLAERAATMIGTAVRANVRSSDRAAVLGAGLYAVLLTETDEIRAVNFVERVRATCEEWLAANAPGVTIAIGWASPEGDGLAAARARAQQRLLRDRG
jgi:GGDEF domain-containing protein